MSPTHRIRERCALILAAAIMFPGVVESKACAAPKGVEPTEEEVQAKKELQNRLCTEMDLDCEYVTSVFGDPRLEIYEPAAPAAEQPPSRPQKEREKNPYLTKRFGLLSQESLERCRSFISAHTAAFAVASEKYGVSKEVICGHL